MGKKGVLKRVKSQNSLSKTVKIGGKNYDKEMILAAKRATRGSKNVLVSKDDAKQILKQLGQKVTVVAPITTKWRRLRWHTSEASTNSPKQLMLSCVRWLRKPA